MGSTEQRSIAVKKYFTKTPEKPSYGLQILLMFFGGVGLLIGFIFTLYFFLLVLSLPDSDSSAPALGEIVCCASPIFIIGLVLSGSGGLGYLTKKSAYDNAYKAAEPKPSDEQMNKWLEEDKRKIISEAINKLDLVPEKILNPNDPLVVIGPQTPTNIQLGKDNIIRFTKYELVVIYLTDYHLAAYNCDLDFYTGKILTEGSQEYHYTDVVSVSTYNENSPFNVITADGKQHQIANHQRFALSVASGERIEVTIAFPQVEGIWKTGTLQPTGTEKAISTIRAMLRDKKGGQ